MEDLDPREQFHSLTLTQKVRVDRAARILALLMTEYDPSANLGGKGLLCQALNDFVAIRASGQVVPDLERFLIATMNDICDQWTNNFVQRYAVAPGNLDPLERMLHISEVVELLENEMIGGDPEAAMIWPLMLEGYSGPEIERMCALPKGRYDGIIKRMRRKAFTLMRARLYLRKGKR
jgi:hypothetical protein